MTAIFFHSGKVKMKVYDMIWKKLQYATVHKKKLWILDYP